jgi:hypothetical protein
VEGVHAKKVFSALEKDDLTCESVPFFSLSFTMLLQMCNSAPGNPQIFATPFGNTEKKRKAQAYTVQTLPQNSRMKTCIKKYQKLSFYNNDFGTDLNWGILSLYL